MMSRRKDKSKNFQTGDLVWAKMRGYPPWPAIIENPPNDDSKTPSKIKRKQHYVFFFGTENFAWIPDENIHHHSDKMVQSVSMKKKPLRFQSAIDRILNLNKAQSKRDEQVEIEKSEKENATITPCTYSKSTSSNISLKKNAEATPRSKGMQQSSEKEKSEKTLNGSPQNTQRKHSFENADLYTGIPSMYPSIKRLRPEDYSFNAANFPGIPSSNSSYDGDPKTTSTSACKQQPLTSESEVLILYDSLQSNNVRATKKKIGFLGLGNMGSVLVMNLIKSGHDVMVWNRTSSRCETLVNAGAKSGQNPADVVTNCDMIFSCVSDPKEVKELVFGKDGVLKGFDSSESGKGYVEMTTIDSGTSKEISEAITRRGGRYLESYIHGSKMGEEGTLLLLISGDRSLFDDCDSCFQAISKHAYYLNSKVGIACMMHLALCMFQGSVCGALAEAMALVECVNLSQNDFLEIVALNQFNCRTIMGKGRAILKRDFTTGTPLRHAQTALDLALKLSKSSDPTPLVAVHANELYKKSKFLQYGDHGVSAVYMGVTR